MGWAEIEGIASRTDFDLKQHQKFSGQDLSYYNNETKEKFIPFVIEPSAGVERVMLALLCDAYEEIEGGRTQTTEQTKETEILLRLNKKIAPIQLAVLPLVKNKEEIREKAKNIYCLLKGHFYCQYDEVGTIGRRYRRQDESGTPFALTVDFDTLKTEDVTIRDRDTMEQERVKIAELIDYFNNKLK